MAHRLDPLLRPGSIAVLGATDRAESVGLRTMLNLQAGGFEGRLYPVNPGRDRVCGLPCFASLGDLPESVDHVIFAISDYRIEAALEEVIAHGVKAVTIMSQLIIEEDAAQPLAERVGSRLQEAGILVCGPNGMGFYNGYDGVWVCGFDTRENHIRGGNVTLISHSGSGMAGIVDCEERIDFNLAVSTGQELNVSMPDYMDFAIEAHDTAVIGLFMETIRNPPAMIRVLEKARDRKIPVVALKVGCTQFSAQLAESHSGAMAGEDAAYDALFDRFGVQRVSDMNELATALIMFAQPAPIAEGGLAAILDSGGERQLLIDLAETMGTPLAHMSPATVTRLESKLDPGLPAVNPLDAWGAGGPDSDTVMQDCLAALLSDPATALGAVVHDRGPHSSIYPEYFDYLRAARRAADKPLFLVSNCQGSGTDPQAVERTREGFPVLDGVRSFLVGVNCLLSYRDFLARPVATTQLVEADSVARARSALAGSVFDEAAASKWLHELGLPMNASRIAGSETEALSAAAELGFPVVMKTAIAGIAHKTEVDGIRLGLADAAAVSTAWQDLSGRLGTRVVISPMIDMGGLEMALGMIHDDQFGPLVMLGFGGTNLEAMADVIYAIPPFDAATAQRLIDKLKQSALFKHDRGTGAPDIGAYCETAARFSNIVAALASEVTEIDINPLIVQTAGCVAVDALVIRREPRTQAETSRKAS